MSFPSRVNTSATSNWGGNSQTTQASNAQAVTAGNTLIVFAGADAGANAVTSVVDTAGNTYTKIDHCVLGGSYRGEVWYAKNVTGHASNIVTVTWAAAVWYRTLEVLQYTGLSATTPYDATAQGGATSGVITIGALTTTKWDEFHLIMLRSGWNTAGTYPPGFARISTGDPYGDVLEALVSAPVTSKSYQVTHPAAWAMVVAFAPDAGGTGPVRITDAVVELLAQPSPPIRVTQVVVEAVTQPIAPARMTQVVVELLTNVIGGERSDLWID